MATNADNLEKVTTGAFSDGGLSEQEFEQFFQDIQGEGSGILNRARGVPVSAPEGDVPRLDIPARSMQAVAEGEQASLTGIDQPSVHYQTQKVSIAKSLTWEAINETIGTAQEAIRAAMVQGFAADLERLASVGDESSADAFESINDGWITVAENRGSPTYDHSGDPDGDGTATPQPVNKDLFSGMLKKLPTRYKEAGELAFLMSYDQMFSYKEGLTERTTAAGDALLLGQEEPTGFGRPIISPRDWPDDTVLLANLSNLCYIVQDEMRVESTTEGKDLVLSDISVVMNLLGKVDFQLLEPAGVVVGTGIAAP